MPDPILIQYGKYYNIPIHLYYIEADSDASNIPAGAPIGSMAYVNESGNFHVLMKDSSSNWNTISTSGSSLPAVTSADNGKVLAVEDGAWAASEQGKKFLVTLTPTALDYSGTMDKTVAEITAAYEAGMEIWFTISDGVNTHSFSITEIVQTSADYPSFNGYVIFDGNLILVETGSTSDGTSALYFTTIYPLTPAS